MVLVPTPHEIRTIRTSWWMDMLLVFLVTPSGVMGGHGRTDDQEPAQADQAQVPGDLVRVRDDRARALGHLRNPVVRSRRHRRHIRRARGRKPGSRASESILVVTDILIPALRVRIHTIHLHPNTTQSLSLGRLAMAMAVTVGWMALMLAKTRGRDREDHTQLLDRTMLRDIMDTHLRRLPIPHLFYLEESAIAPQVEVHPGPAPE